MAVQLQAGIERGDGNRGAGQDETEAEQSSPDPLSQLSRDILVLVLEPMDAADTLAVDPSTVADRLC